MVSQIYGPPCGVHGTMGEMTIQFPSPEIALSRLLRATKKGFCGFIELLILYGAEIPDILLQSEPIPTILNRIKEKTIEDIFNLFSLDTDKHLDITRSTNPTFGERFNNLKPWHKLAYLNGHSYKNKDTIFHRAVDTGDLNFILEVINIFIENNAVDTLERLLNTDDCNSYTPGALALVSSYNFRKKGSYEKLEILIDKFIKCGANPQKIKDGFEVLDKNPDYNALGLGKVINIINNSKLEEDHAVNGVGRVRWVKN